MLKETTCKDCTIKKVLLAIGGEHNKLYRYVIKDIFRDSQSYSGNKKERLLARCEDVQHGCSTGVVSNLIYYRDTTAFFKKYKKEIGCLVSEMIADGIINGIHELRDYDKDDPFCNDIYNQNLLARLAYEEINNKLYWYLES